VILAKNLERLLRRRFAVVREILDAPLPCRHPFYPSSFRKEPPPDLIRGENRFPVENAINVKTRDLFQFSETE